MSPSGVINLQRNLNKKALKFTAGVFFPIVTSFNFRRNS